MTEAELHEQVMNDMQQITGIFPGQFDRMNFHKTQLKAGRNFKASIHVGDEMVIFSAR